MQLHERFKTEKQLVKGGESTTTQTSQESRGNQIELIRYNLFLYQKRDPDFENCREIASQKSKHAGARNVQTALPIKGYCLTHFKIGKSYCRETSHQVILSKIFVSEMLEYS